MSSWIIIDGTNLRTFPGLKLRFSWLEAVNTIKRFHFLLPWPELCQTKGARLRKVVSLRGAFRDWNLSQPLGMLLKPQQQRSRSGFSTFFIRQSELGFWSRPPSVPCKQTSRSQLSDSLIKKEFELWFVCLSASPAVTLVQVDERNGSFHLTYF